MSRVGLRNADYTNSKHSLEIRSSDVYTDKNVNENIEIETGMEKYTIAQDDHEYDNKTEISNKTVGGMAVEPYQYNDIEEAPPLLEVGDNQNENNDSIDSSVQGREDASWFWSHLDTKKNTAGPESLDASTMYWPKDFLQFLETGM